MAKRDYFVLVVWDDENGMWCNEAGHYDRADCVADADAMGLAKNRMRILCTDGGSADLNEWLKTLAAPKGCVRK